MRATNTLSDLLSTIIDRRAFGRGAPDGRGITDLCLALMSERAEASGRQIAGAILDKYALLDLPQRADFFAFLNDDLDLDAAKVAELAQAYETDRTAKAFRALTTAAEPRRQQLFRKLNEAPGATARLVRLRRDLLSMMKTAPELARTDHDLVHLLRSWFNRGFLVTREITWDSPASVLEKIIAYEAVHQIQTWDDLRRRLQPVDRRCFAFFHPVMPDEPLIFVEIALTKGIPNSIQGVLAEDREEIDASEANTAVFYSISNCQDGLARVSFGNSLIKQVARDLAHDLPNLKTFVTLSPIPGLTRWLEARTIPDSARGDEDLPRLAAHYLLEAKTSDGMPVDPVARFHLGNGAQVHAVHAKADLSDTGLAQSGGAMVNYHYDLARVSRRANEFASSKKVAATSAVKALAKQANALLPE